MDVLSGYVVSIGTTHPWNIAGVGLDARVAAEYAVPHAAVVAAVSAQDASGVHALHVIPDDVLRAQLDALPVSIAAFRIGALVSAQTVRTVASFLRARDAAAPIVVDPVLRASLGGELQSDADLPYAIVEALVPLGALPTPNVQEAEILTGIRVDGEHAMHAAGQFLVDRGAVAALVTGGHLSGDPVDVLVTRDGSERLSGPRLPGDMRGSGCTLAAALACELARGANVREAAARAHAYVREKIAGATVRDGLQVAF
ncbi:MAG TPA: PfkB family carbohydrate kinase [Candidatus Baltobacteraceae bacterium]|nr:PfkB family carbohydrate kinase [Candidatus Baltobacteraceae bacterium]